MVSSCGSGQKASREPTLKDYFQDDFLIGAAIPVYHVDGMDPKADSIVVLHYNSVVPENCMKCEKIHPEENVYFWDDADKFVKYGEDNNMDIIGHCLIWHSQLAPWFAVDSLGNDVAPEVLEQRMKDHITTIMTRYKGKIKGWDVVNEAIEDDGTYRQSPFYRILGEEYIPLAFEYAHEVDPDVELYINDYNMAHPAKREAYVKLVNDLKASGHRVDGIGIQGHMGMDYPDMVELEKSIEAFAGTGAKVAITEWDMSALPTIRETANVSAGETLDMSQFQNPYPDGIPREVIEEWNRRMGEYLALFKKHAKEIDRVTFWGTYDGMSWRNDWPIPGRTDYALPFDRSYELKPFLKEAMQN